MINCYDIKRLTDRVSETALRKNETSFTFLKIYFGKMAKNVKNRARYIHHASCRTGEARWDGAGGAYFTSMNTSTSGQRLATGWMEGRAMILQNSLLSVEMDSR